MKLTGIQTGLMMIRSSMFVGWKELYQKFFGPKPSEFISLDAKRYSHDPRKPNTIEIGSPINRVDSGNTTASPNGEFASHDYRDPRLSDIHSIPSPTFERQYRQPRMSFSVPRPATATPPPSKPIWDTTESFRPNTASSQKYNHSRRSKDDGSRIWTQAIRILR